MKYIDTWDLESIIPGGTNSPELKAKIEKIEVDMDSYKELLLNWEFTGNATSIQTFKQVLQKQEALHKKVGQAATFVTMWHDAYMDDKHANVMKGHLMEQFSELQKLSNTFTKKLVDMDEVTWKTVLKADEFKEIAFVLGEIRQQGKRLLSEAEEKLLAELNKDGLAAWSNLYQTTVSIMTIPYTEDGYTVDLSIGQAMNRMYADPDPEVRKQIFENWEAAWEKYAPIFTDTLNHLSGYRLTLQKHHDYHDHLEEPLEYNRMKRATLDAMWGAVSNHKQPFIDYLKKKADLLGLGQLGWEDVDAPIALGGVVPTTYTYDEACDFVIENFSSFGKELTNFTKHALENRWVEAENRPNKRPGGYCTSLPEFEESRIFMTFTGSPSDTSTLAHELGHAFHSHVMKDIPVLNRNYAMNVAETASTFAEMIIADATVKNASSDEEKIALLGSKLEKSTAMFLNIHARFLFEDAFYTERAQGVVSEQRINELMTEAQKEAYGDSLSSYHPHFWCSKLHFFIDSDPFYNFPYTFGYLFSLGIYAAYLQEPEGFEEKYIALLKDTGSMDVEDLAKKHLNVDITKQEFWTAGIELMQKDVEEFMRLTKEINA